MTAGPERFGALCGCSDSREVWISFSSIPAPFSACSTLPIAALLASEASRAVLASDVTPPSISARSGGTDTVASPVTEMAAGGITCASAGALSSAPARAAAARAVRCFMSSLQRHVDVDHQLVFRCFQRVGDVFLDEGILGFELLVVEVIGDGLIGVVHIVVRTAMDKLQRLAVGRFADAHVLGEVLRILFARDFRKVREAGIVRGGVDDHRIAGWIDALIVENARPRIGR